MSIPKKFWLVVVGLAVAVSLVVAIIVFGDDQPAPVPTVDDVASPTPVGTGSFVPLPASDPKVLRQDPQDANPVITALPRLTPYWSLAVVGRGDDDRYVLEATVYHRAGEDPQGKIDQQRPYIEQFIAGTGQPPGSYELRLKAQEVYDD